MKKIFSRLPLPIIFVLIFTLISPTSFALAYNKNDAVNYLTSHANNLWSIMGLVALGASDIPQEYLKTVAGTTANDFSKTILAITSLGNDPRTFGAQDYVAKLKTFHTQNQLGDVSTVNDDIFGTLALISAGEPLNDNVITDAKNYILHNQKPDGGWGFAIAGNSDSNMTAAAIVALKAFGLASTDAKITSALNYLKAVQNNDGGFTYDPQSPWGTDSDSSSTSWVLWALNSLNIDQATWSKNGHTPFEYLASTQTSGGYFEYQTGSAENSLSADNTAWAAIALEGKTLPLKIITPFLKQFDFRIEGSIETICEGKTQGPTAIDIIKNAASLCGFTYHIKDTSFGPYLDKINNDEAGGIQGWQYWVNFASPSIGAADYQLGDGDEVLWAYGSFDIKPTSLSLSPTEINSGQTSQAEVQYFDGGNKPLEGAKVIIGTSEFITDNSGQAQISGSDGFYKVFAQKPGFVRSNKILLKIGNPASAAVNLAVNILPGQINGTSTQPGISFMIDPSSLDFGSLPRGGKANKNLVIKNIGDSTLEFESQVTAGQLFKENLKLDGKLWQQFLKELNSGQEAVVAAEISIPPAFSNSGPQNGTLIFWASPK